MLLDPRVTRSLGPLEAAIMAILWRSAEVSVLEVTSELNRGRVERPLAYTTVMTVMARLAGKGLLDRRLTGKAYEYRPRYSQREFIARLSGDRVGAVVEEFGDLALAQFLGHLDKLDAEHLQRLRELAQGERGMTP